MNKRTSLILIALAAVGPTLAGCGTDKLQVGTTGGSNDDAVGNVSLALQLAPGVSVNAFTYSIMGPATRTGMINVSSSTTVSTLVSAIPAGMGYTVALNGTATDGTTCTGTSGTFSVSPAATTPVSVAISCNGAHTTGSVLLKGTINVCAQVTAVSAAPPVGATIAVTATAADVDSGPGPITYKWTTSSGTLSDPTAANPTLTCTQAGTVNLTLTVSDGDMACGDSFAVMLDCPPDSPANHPAWVEIGANNQAIARVVMPYATACPSITIDGTTSPMNLRVGPSTMPVRPTSTDTTLAAAMTSGNSKPSVFTTTTCELNIPAGAVSATVAGISLPLPKAVVNRVVILGDTGCRISIGNVYQNCSDPSAWPFSVISSAAAAMQPDLVLHVGDYQYRDNPCPPGNSACSGTPWGYGSDTWVADVFAPAAPLLKAAPWVMVRGNHETCNRAGQGWYRYLDPNPYNPAPSGSKTCDDAANDNGGNYNDPWAVSFGDTQIISFDSANVQKTAYNPAAFQPYTDELTAAAALATPSFLNIWAVHHPVLGYSAGNPPTLGSPGLQSVMNAHYPGNYYPANVGIAIHGHVHDFQALNFSSNHPATFVAGNGGDNLDSALPAMFDPNTPASHLPAPSTVVNAFAYSQEFGFMVMDRVGAVGSKNWKFTSYRTNGTIIAVCNMAAPVACSGVCDSTPGSQITCVDGSNNVVGSYDNIP